MAENNYFEVLNSINVNDKVEKKNGLSYLSWPFAWGELKKRYPNSTYTIYENSQGWNYFTDGMTCWVKTGVTVNGIEHIEYLPIMDYKNRSIAAGSVTSFDVNKAIQRSLTKAVARHGLGLYIYAGEDLPDEACTAEPPKTKAKTAQAKKAEPKPEPELPFEITTESNRDKFRQYVAENKIGKETIIKVFNKCGLTDNSSDEEWATGLVYLVAMNEGIAQ